MRNNKVITCFPTGIKRKIRHNNRIAKINPGINVIVKSCNIQKRKQCLAQHKYKHKSTQVLLATTFTRASLATTNCLMEHLPHQRNSA
jgi:short-subunit dehydrogenase involved in D-alanine esterification of teichoic acids